MLCANGNAAIGRTLPKKRRESVSFHAHHVKSCGQKLLGDNACLKSWLKLMNNSGPPLTFMALRYDVFLLCCCFCRCCDGGAGPCWLGEMRHAFPCGPSPCTVCISWGHVGSSRALITGPHTKDLPPKKMYLHCRCHVESVFLGTPRFDPLGALSETNALRQSNTDKN